MRESSRSARGDSSSWRSIRRRNLRRQDSRRRRRILTRGRTVTIFDRIAHFFSGSGTPAQAAADDPPAPQQVEEPSSPAPVAQQDDEDWTVPAGTAAALRAFTRDSSAALDVAAAHAWVADASSGTFRPLAVTGRFAPAREPLRLDDPVLGRADTEGRPVLDALHRLDSGGHETVLWRFAFPVRLPDVRAVVALDLLSAEAPDTEPLHLLARRHTSGLAAGIAIDLARSESDAARALVETARDLSRILSEREVVDACLDRAMRLADAATGSVMLVDRADGRMRIAASRGLPDEVALSSSVAAGEGIAGWVLATAKPVLVEDLPSNRPRVPRHGVRSAISVPLTDEHGTLGVLNVGSRSFPARFASTHMDALETLGRQTAVAIRNARAVTSARELYFDSLRALALALETKDPYALGGTERVLAIALAIADGMGIVDEERQALEIASLLHDIGMSGAGEISLLGERPLSTVERGLLKMHPVVAAEILEQAPALKAVVPIVYHHHEWFDGHGYVGGLAGECIPLGARVLAAADAYVAMTSDRPYRKALSRDQSILELETKAGTQFDPEVVEVLVRILRSGSERVPDSR
ncbi:MAG: hypothetical protein C0418_03325 [Coriobacteriaceae bacterium]|nr:hypothetical protein [Coriobacteriaceae bacterium]